MTMPKKIKHIVYESDRRHNELHDEMREWFIKKIEEIQREFVLDDYDCYKFDELIEEIKSGGMNDKNK